MGEFLKANSSSALPSQSHTRQNKINYQLFTPLIILTSARLHIFDWKPTILIDFVNINLVRDPNCTSLVNIKFCFDMFKAASYSAVNCFDRAAAGINYFKHLSVGFVGRIVKPALGVFGEK